MEYKRKYLKIRKSELDRSLFDKINNLNDKKHHLFDTLYLYQRKSTFYYFILTLTGTHTYPLWKKYLLHNVFYMVGVIFISLRLISSAIYNFPTILSEDSSFIQYYYTHLESLAFSLSQLSLLIVLCFGFYILLSLCLLKGSLKKQNTKYANILLENLDNPLILTDAICEDFADEDIKKFSTLSKDEQIYFLDIYLSVRKTKDAAFPLCNFGLHWVYFRKPLFSLYFWLIGVALFIIGIASYLFFKQEIIFSYLFFVLLLYGSTIIYQFTTLDKKVYENNSKFAHLIFNYLAHPKMSEKTIQPFFKIIIFQKDFDTLCSYNKEDQKRVFHSLAINRKNMTTAFLAHIFKFEWIYFEKGPYTLIFYMLFILRFFAQGFVLSFVLILYFINIFLIPYEVRKINGCIINEEEYKIY